MAEGGGGGGCIRNDPHRKKGANNILSHLLHLLFLSLLAASSSFPCIVFWFMQVRIQTAGREDFLEPKHLLKGTFPHQQSKAASVSSQVGGGAPGSPSMLVVGVCRMIDSRIASWGKLEWGGSKEVGVQSKRPPEERHSDPPRVRATKI